MTMQQWFYSPSMHWSSYSHSCDGRMSSGYVYIQICFAKYMSDPNDDELNQSTYVMVWAIASLASLAIFIIYF